MLHEMRRIALPLSAAAGIDEAVAQPVGNAVAARRRRLHLERVDDLKGGQVVVASQPGQMTQTIRVHRVEVGQQEHQATGAGNPAEARQRSGEVPGDIDLPCLAPRREAALGVTGLHQGADQAHLSAATTSGLQLLMPAVEEQRADAIAMTDRRPADQRREPRRDDGLERAVAGEEHARPKVHDHHHWPLALLVEHLDVRMPGARGDAPIHVADVVAGLVVARLAIVHTATTKARTVRARQRRARRQRSGRLQPLGPTAQGDQVVGVDTDVGICLAESWHLFRSIGLEVSSC